MTRGGNGGGAWAPARVRGFQPPYSRDQLAAMILYPILTAGFYAVASIYMPREYLPPVLVIHSALVVVVVACWIYVETVDPSKPGGIPCFCMKHTQSSSRYCANCRKSVPGLDHHCLWLNTCIGTRNYFFFFLLSVCGTLQFGLQALVSILLLTKWLTGPVQAVVKDTLLQLVFFQVIMIVHSVASGGAMLGFGSLCVFHSYLQGLGMGTYDWVLSKRDYGTSPAQPTASSHSNGAAPTTTTTNTANGGARSRAPTTTNTAVSSSGKGVELTGTVRRPAASMGADPEVDDGDVEKGLNLNLNDEVAHTHVAEEREGQVLSMPQHKDKVEKIEQDKLKTVGGGGEEQGAEAAKGGEDGSTAAREDKTHKAERGEGKRGGVGEGGKGEGAEMGGQGEDKGEAKEKRGEQAEAPGDEEWHEALRPRSPEERWEDATYHDHT